MSSTRYNCESIVRPKYSVYRHVLKDTWDKYTPKVKTIHYDDDRGDWGPEYDVFLNILNTCIIKYPEVTDIEVFNLDEWDKVPYILEDYFEIIFGKKHIDLGGYLHKGVREDIRTIKDHHHDEYVDIINGFVRPGHFNYNVGLITYDLADPQYSFSGDDDIGYGDYTSNGKRGGEF